MKTKWEEMSNDEYVAVVNDRIFKLKLGARGVLGIGKAYYLSTKLRSESEFSSVHGIVVDDDNHGLQLDKRLSKDFRYYNPGAVKEVFKIAESYFKLY